MGTIPLFEKEKLGAAGWTSVRQTLRRAQKLWKKRALESCFRALDGSK